MATSTPAPGYYGNSGGGFGGSGMTQIQQMVSDWVRERGRRGEIFTSQLGGDQVRVHVLKGPHACAWTLNSDGVRILLILWIISCSPELLMSFSAMRATSTPLLMTSTSNPLTIIHRKLLLLHGVLCIVHLNWPWRVLLLS